MIIYYYLQNFFLLYKLVKIYFKKINFYKFIKLFKLLWLIHMILQKNINKILIILINNKFLKITEKKKYKFIKKYNIFYLKKNLQFKYNKVYNLYNILEHVANQENELISSRFFSVLALSINGWEGVDRFIIEKQYFEEVNKYPYLKSIMIPNLTLFLSLKNYYKLKIFNVYKHNFLDIAKKFFYILPMLNWKNKKKVIRKKFIKELKQKWSFQFILLIKLFYWFINYFIRQKLTKNMYTLKLDLRPKNFSNYFELSLRSYKLLQQFNSKISLCVYIYYKCWFFFQFINKNTRFIFTKFINLYRFINKKHLIYKLKKFFFIIFTYLFIFLFEFNKYIIYNMLLYFFSKKKDINIIRKKKKIKN